MTELADPRVGALMGGRYRLEDCLGAGAMGAVYRATALADGKTVAVKLLHEGFALQPNFVKRFEREAEAMRRLSHPHLTQVLDSGVEGTTPFLVMEYHQGRSLDHVLKDGALESGWAVSIARQILEGIHHAHQSGVVHRDLKPENIQLLDEKAGETSGGESGLTEVKILDFGLAKFVDGEESALKLTQTGMAMGTPYYMSPEQALGSSVDLRSDIYAVGVILYEMVVGRPPFYAENPMAVLRMHLDKPPPSPREAAPESGCSEELEAAILHSLAKEPEHRWQTAEEFGMALAATPEAQDPAAARSRRQFPVARSPISVRGLSSGGPATATPTPVTPSGTTPGLGSGPGLGPGPGMTKPVAPRSEQDPLGPARPSVPQRPVAPDPAKTAVVTPRAKRARAAAESRPRRRVSVWVALALLGGGVTWVGLDPRARHALGLAPLGSGHGPIEPRPSGPTIGPTTGGQTGSEPGRSGISATGRTAPSVRGTAGSKYPVAPPPSKPPVASPTTPPPGPPPGTTTAAGTPGTPPKATPAAPGGADGPDDDGTDDPMPQDTPGAQLERQAAQPGVPQRPATVRHAGQLIASGRLEEGLEELYAVRRHSPRDADAALLLGHAYFRKNWRSDGLRTYAEAIVLRRSLRTDKPLQRNIIRALDDPTFRLARSTLRNHVGAAAVPELRKAAMHADNPKVKLRAAKLLEQLGPAPAPPTKKKRK